MLNVPIEEAAQRFEELATRAAGGEKVVVTRNGEPVCEIVKTEVPPQPRPFPDHDSLRKFYAERGITSFVGWIADDFDAPIDEEDFIEGRF